MLGRAAAILALFLLAAQDPKSAQDWIDRARECEARRDWAGARDALDRAVEIEKSSKPDLAHFERGMLPFRYMLNAMPFANPSAAGALTPRQGVWFVRVNLAYSVTTGWVIPDFVGFNDPNDPLIRESAALFDALRKNPARGDEALVGDATIAYLQGRRAKTDYFLRRALTKRPDDPDLLIVAALHAVRLHDAAGALEFVDRAIQKREAAPFPYFLRAGLRVVVKEDFAGAFGDVSRFAAAIEPAWGRIVEHGAKAAAMALDGGWRTPEFKKALTALADAIIDDPDLKPTNYLEGMFVMLWGPLVASLKDPDVQDRAIAFADALSKVPADADAPDVGTTLTDLADVFVNAPKGRRSLLMYVFKPLKDPDVARRFVALCFSVFRLTQDCPPEEKIKRWEKFAAAVKENLPATPAPEKPKKRKTWSGVGPSLAALAEVLADGAQAALYDEMDDDERRKEKLRSVLKLAGSDDFSERIAALFSVGSFAEKNRKPLGASIAALIRCVALIELGDREAAVRELNYVFPLDPSTFGTILQTGWKALDMIEAGTWTEPAFRDALTTLADALVTAYGKEGRVPAAVAALKDAAVQEKGIALAKLLTRDEFTEAGLRSAINAFFVALEDSPWGQDDILLDFTDPVLLNDALPIAVAVAAALKESDPKKAIERWEKVREPLLLHIEPLVKRGREVLKIKGNDNRRLRLYRFVVDRLPDLLPALIDVVEFRLGDRIGDAAGRRARLESLLRFCEKMKSELPADGDVPPQLFEGAAVLIEHALGHREPAARKLEAFLDALEAAVNESAFQKNFPKIKKLIDVPDALPAIVRPALVPICEAFEDVDPDLGARWAKLLAPLGVNRDREIWHRRVRLAVSQKKFDDALALVDMALAENADDADAMLTKIDVLTAQDRTREAMDLCIEAEKKDPWMSGAYRRQAAMLSKKGDAAAAVDALGALIERDRFDADALREKSALEFGLTRAAEAWIDAEHALELDSASPCDIESIQSKLGAPEKAIESLDAAITAAPRDAWLYATRGGVRASMKAFDQAVADLDRAIEIDPRYAHAFDARGCARAAKKDFDGAIGDFARALQLNGAAETFFHRAQARAAKGDKAGAARDLVSYLQSAPGGARAAEARKLLDELAK